MRHGIHARTFILISALACACGPAIADTTNLLPSADTALRNSAPDNNFGAVSPLPVGTSASGLVRNRCLLRFDLTALPANATITSVTLQIIAVNGPGSGNFELHRLLKDWGEGVQTGFSGSGAPAQENEATWNSRFHLNAAWDAGGAQSGTDYASSTSASAPLTSTTNDFSSATLQSDVQLWVQNASTNFGWILIAAGETAGSGKLIGAREDPDTTPVLIVQYTAPPPLVAPLLFGAKLTNNQFRFSFNAQSNHLYTTEFRGALSGTNWTAFATNGPHLTDTVISITQTLTSTQRFFRVRTQ